MNKTFLRLILLCLISVSVLLFAGLDLGQYLSFEYLKEKQVILQDFYSGNMFLTIIAYMLIYIVVTALSLPGAAVLSLAGGVLLGFGVGVIAVSFASSIGATLAFLASRFILRDYVQDKFGDRLRIINEGMEKDGAFYLFSLRLVPLFPFFMVNLLMGLTPISVRTYYLVSQLGMLPATLVFINAGTRIGMLESVSGIISPSMLISLALLGVVPIISRKGIEYYKARKIMAGYSRPRNYDYNLVVIGAGAAGLVSSYISAAVKAKVVIIEKNRMGGDCLNTGCVPSKAFIRASKLISDVNRAREFGFRKGYIEFDFCEIMDRVKDIIKQIEPHDSRTRYETLGVECIEGEATVISPYEVKVNGRVITTKGIVVATGARPAVPSLPGIELVEYLTSDNLWDLRALPERLVILGGGPIGCELSQAFARLGSKVTQVEMLPRLMSREDPDLSGFIKTSLEADGVTVLVSHSATGIRVKEGQNILVCNHDGGEKLLEFDKILLAIGREPNVKGFGLEKLGVYINDRGSIGTNAFLQTNIPTIFCAGDVAGPFQFTHVAAHQAWYASVNALFGWLRKFRVDYRVIPWAIFTDPEIARVGLSEAEAKANGIAFDVTVYDVGDLDRAITDSAARGYVKVLTKKGGDKIIGVAIAAHHASDIISEFVLAMKYGIGLNKILRTIHIYPTMAEANKYAAGEWKKARTPEVFLKIMKKIHALRRR